MTERDNKHRTRLSPLKLLKARHGRARIYLRFRLPPDAILTAATGTLAIAWGLDVLSLSSRTRFSEVLQAVGLVSAAVIVVAALGRSNNDQRRWKRLLTAHKKLRSYLQGSRNPFGQTSELFSATLNHMNQGLAMVSTTGQILIYNRRAVEYSGVDEEAFGYPANVEDVFRAEMEAGEFGKDLELLPEDVRSYFLSREGNLPLSYVRRRPNGQVLEVRTEVIPNAGFVQSYTDITELMEAKEAAEAGARAKSAFLATMSHEIRTPLNGVLGMATLLRNSPLTVEQGKWVDVITESGDALLTVINDVLDFSKLDAQMVEVERMPLDLDRLVQSALDVVTPAAAAKGLEVRLVRDGCVPPHVRADAKRLRQVLLNLLSNAVKFTQTGTVTLRISPSVAQADGIRVEIEDTGIGIAPDARERLFREFSQVDASINRRFGGTGLGLAISKKIIEAMDGTIGVVSEAGRGSCFWFDISAPPCEAPPQITDTVAPVQRVRGRLRILLVEDMAVNRMVARGMLEMLGHQVSIAVDGLEALAEVRERPFDVILMDMQMPRMNGLDATRAIRSLGDRWASIPIIAMTANAMSDEKQACLAAGMDDFLTKPVDLTQLQAAIERMRPANPDAEAADDGHEPLDRDRVAMLLRHVGPDGLAELFDDLSRESADQLRALEDALVSAHYDAAIGILRALAEAMADLGLDSRALQGARYALKGGLPLPSRFTAEVQDAIAAGVERGRALAAGG